MLLTIVAIISVFSLRAWTDETIIGIKCVRPQSLFIKVHIKRVVLTDQSTLSGCVDLDQYDSGSSSSNVIISQNRTRNSSFGAVIP